MDETEFWELIDGSREDAEGDPDEQADLLVERLLERAPDDVADFARHFEARADRAYRWDLWGAAWLLRDGVSEESFDLFRCWLIGQGRRVFEGALREPDALAELLADFDPEVDGEAAALGCAADDAHALLLGTELPELGLPEPPAEPLGEPLDLAAPEEDALLAERYPRLWARFRA